MTGEIDEDDFNHLLSKALAQSNVVQLVLRDTLLEDPAFAEKLNDTISDRIASTEAARPKVYQLTYWKRSVVWGPVIGFAAAIIGVLGLEWQNVINTRDIVHQIIGTEEQVEKLLINSDEVSEKVRISAHSLPLLVSHGWDSFNIFPGTHLMKSVCQSKISNSEAQVDIRRKNLFETQRRLGWERRQNAPNAANRSFINDLKQQAEIDGLFLKRAKETLETDLFECSQELPDPTIDYSFFAQQGRDTVSGELRVLKFAKDSRTGYAIPREDSDLFSIQLVSYSTQRSETVEHTWVDDGVLSFDVDADMLNAIAGDADKIFSLSVTLDRQKLSKDTLNYGVGLVSIINPIN